MPRPPQLTFEAWAAEMRKALPKPVTDEQLRHIWDESRKVVRRAAGEREASLRRLFGGPVEHNDDDTAFETQREIELENRAERKDQ